MLQDRGRLANRTNGNSRLTGAVGLIESSTVSCVGRCGFSEGWIALKLKELANLIGGEVVGDGEVEIQRVAPIEKAQEGDITFVSNPKYKPFAQRTKASAVIVSPQLKSLPHNLVVTRNPYLAFAKALGALMDKKPRPLPGTHPSAVIAPTARLGKDVSIGPHVVIDEEARIGEGVTVMAGSYIGRGVVIGDGTVIHPNVSLYTGVKVGERCTIHSNVVIGSDGFGWAPDGKHYVGIPQVGTTEVGDDVCIGASCVINRGALGNTVIGRGTKLDSFVIISHNVEIGEDCLFVSLVGISGSVKIGNHVTLGGQVGVAGHLKIGDNVEIAAQSGVTHDLAPNCRYLGAPARPIHEMRRTLATFNELPKLRNQIRRVQKHMADIATMLGRDVTDMTKSAT